MVPFVDTHCHLDLMKDIKDNIEKENESSIKTITVTNAPFLWKANQELFKELSNIRTALGLHPELASTYKQEIQLFESLCKETKYIGEIGLDGSNDVRATWDIQLATFRQILQILSKEEPKILTVHSRRAASETITEIKSHLINTNHRIIMHWFSGTSMELKNAIEAGFYFSVNHMMLASSKGLSFVNSIPFDKILTETDAPFTFANTISTREQSLNKTIALLSKVWKLSFLDTKYRVWNNFKMLLS